MIEHDHGLYRRPGSRFWWMSFYCPDKNGRAVKVQKSTKETSKAKARKVRDAATGSIANGARHHVEKVSFADLEHGLLADYRIRGNKSTGRASIALSHLRDTFGGLKATQVTPRAINTYLMDRTETAVLGTVYYELAILRRAFKLAVRRGELATVPTFPDMRKLNNARQGFFTDADVALLQVELPEHLRGLALFAYLTSWRKMEMLNLTWGRVDMDDCVVWLEGPGTKSKRARTFPFKHYPALKAVIEVQREYAEQWEYRTGKIVTHVFTNKGKPIKDYDCAWRSACRRAGLGGRTMHDNRRSAVRNMIRAGIPKHTAMKLSGHLTSHVFDRYDIVDHQDLEDATAKLGHRGDITGTVGVGK